MADIIIHDITINEFADYDHDGIGYLIGTGRVDVIDEQPAVDAEPVVRCRDCKHGEEENETEWIGGRTPFYCGFHGGLFDGDCYCSFAERREDDRTV